jgi:hypothetical protein
VQTIPRAIFGFILGCVFGQRPERRVANTTTYTLDLPILRLLKLQEVRKLVVLSYKETLALRIHTALSSLQDDKVVS